MCFDGDDAGVKANLNILLNEYFYNKTSISSTYGSCSNWSYYYNGSDYRTNDCSNIVGYGIDSSLQNYIETVTWYLYGYSDSQFSEISKQNFYLCERGQYSGCTSANSGAYSATATGKIGLMYVSDQVYASAYYADSDTSVLGYDGYYGNQNWLYNGDEWTITPINNSDVDVLVSTDGSFLISYTYESRKIRPSFYLKESVYVTGGDGSFDNPYTISM